VVSIDLVILYSSEESPVGEYSVPASMEFPSFPLSTFKMIFIKSISLIWIALLIIIEK